MTIMYHHDERPYEVAASEAAKAMRDKLEARVAASRDSSAAAVKRIFTEIPEDRIVDGPAMRFEPSAAGVQVVYEGQVVQDVHRHALGQIAEHARVPNNYLRHLFDQGDWGRELAAECLSRAYAHDRDADGDVNKHLVRSVGNQTRGFLSTKYKRRDPRPLLNRFLETAKEIGAVAYDATCTDTKWMVRAVIADPIEPIPNEVIFLGVEIAESSYGNGSTDILPWVERAWCTNKATCETRMRKVHLGRDLAEGGIAWSAETVRTETALLASQMQDTIRHTLGAGAIAKLVATVKAAHEQKVDHRSFEDFLKKNLTRDQAAKVSEIYRSTDIEMLPAGDNLWRASNALSFFAHSVEEPEAKYAVGKLAGQIMLRAQA